MTKEERKLYMKKYYEDHKEERNLYNKIYRENHKEEIALSNRISAKKYRENHKEEIKLSLKKWNKNNRDYKQKNQQDRMNRTSFAKKHMNKWTSNEELYLISNAPYKTAYEIALELGRSENAVLMKAKRIGVSLNKYK